MNNYKLTIQYNGTNYSGWQIQNNAVTIQQKISEAIRTITREEVNLIGSGRTDAGVHALGQVANFRINKELDCRKVSFSLNSILPDDIAIVEMEKIGEDFHARFDAKKRSYMYVINTEKSPFYKEYSAFIPRAKNYNMERLNSLSRYLLGEKDFTSFARKQTEVENKKCNLYGISWRRSKNMIFFYVEANRFLHGMVRTIVGTLLFAIDNDLDENYLREVLEAKDRCKAAMAAPSEGLFLYKVKY